MTESVHLKPGRHIAACSRNTSSPALLQLYSTKSQSLTVLVTNCFSSMIRVHQNDFFLPQTLLSAHPYLHLRVCHFLSGEIITWWLKPKWKKGDTKVCCCVSPAVYCRYIFRKPSWLRQKENPALVCLRLDAKVFLHCMQDTKISSTCAPQHKHRKIYQLGMQRAGQSSTRTEAEQEPRKNTLEAIKRNNKCNWLTAFWLTYEGNST